MYKKRFLAYLLALLSCITLLAPCAAAMSGGYDEDGWTNIGHVHDYSGAKVRVEPTCEKEGYVGIRCTGCTSIEKEKTLAALGHDFAYGVCSRCKAKDPGYNAGDFTGDDEVNNEDVVYFLWHILFPNDFPLTKNADFTGDGEVNNKDVVYFLWHTLFPDEYPIS